MYHNCIKEKDLAILQEKIPMIINQLEKIDTKVSEGFEKIYEKIDNIVKNAEEKYAKKEDLETANKRIDWFNDRLIKFLIAIIFILLGSTGYLIKITVDFISNK